MPDSVAELVVDVSAKETVSAVLARLESQLDKTNTSVEKIAAGLQTKLGGSQQKAAQDALAHAQAQARLSAASGDLAGAIRTMQAALQGIPAGTTAAIRAETQLVQLQTKLAKELSGTSQFVDAFKQGLFGLVAPAAAAGAALTALRSTAQSFVDAFQFKAQLDATTAAVKSQLDGFRDVNATYAEAAEFGRRFNITQEETNSILLSSVGSLRTSTASVTQLETALLRLQSKDPSKPISEAARALAELESGDVTSIKELFRVSAVDALAMRDAIVAGGDSVQVLTAYLDRTQTGMQALELRTRGAAGAMAELKVAQEDLALAQAQFAEGPGLAILQARINVTRDVTQALGGDFQALNAIINDSGVGALNPFLGILGSYNDAVLGAGKSVLEWAGVLPTAAAANDQLTSSTQISAGAFDDERSALGAAQVAAQAHTAETQKTAEAAVLAAAQQQAQKAATDQLTESTNAEVSAFLAMNPLIDAAGIAAQVAAGKIPALIGQLAALRVEAYSTRDAVAALAAAQGLNVKSNLTASGLGINAPGLTSGKNNSVDAVFQLQQANAKAAEDQIKGDLAIAKAKGDTAAQIALIRKQQAGLNKDSLEYKNLQADIIGLEKGKKGGGGGASSTRLSDQQKLNNSLLANQEAADNKAEDAERTHQERILQIQADYAKKQREQLAANEVSKRQSQADFYDRLTSSELNKKKGGSEALKVIDADYQATYQKSQELAQAGNAKLAADYLALKQRQADQELSYQEALAKAAEEKDQAEIGRLQSIHALRQQANTEEEKQLLAAGDSNVNARDQQLADESADNENKQDKIALASERSADRQITAAQRAGKQIDENQLKLDKLGASYDRIAPGATSTAGATGAPATQPQTSGDQAASATTSPNDALIAVIQTGLAAIVEAVKQETSATKSVESAVRSSGERLMR